ncbi:MAG: hypothetical protein ACYC1D_06040, partial [Acidimicrobiales bacterium]
AVSEPAVSEPAVSEPAVSEPAVSEPAVSEPAVSDVAGYVPPSVLHTGVPPAARPLDISDRDEEDDSRLAPRQSATILDPPHW